MNGKNGLGSVGFGGLLRPTTPEPVQSRVVSPAEPEPVGEVDQVQGDRPAEPVRRRRRIATGSKVLKATIPADLHRRLILAGLSDGRKPSAVLIDLLERHLPRLAIRGQ
jgi:hypothetical protein